MSRKIARRSRGGEQGSASLELVGALPVLLLAVLVAAQLAIAAAALWSAGVAARAGARASAVGRPPGRAARSALPPPLRSGSSVAKSGSAVAVSVPVPRLLPVLPPLDVAAKTRVAPDG